jgi:midasin (ATPase involved in ribosome maturation)
LKVANVLRTVIEELVFLASRSAQFATGIHLDTGVPISLEYNIRFASALSKLCRVSPACLTMAKMYFNDFDVLRPLETLWPFLQKESGAIPTDKDAKIFSHVSELLVEVLRTTWRLVKLSSFPINQSALLNILQKCGSAFSGSSSHSALIFGSDSQQMVGLLQSVYILASQSLSHTLGISDSEMQSLPSFLNAQHSSYLAMVDEEDSGEYQLMLASASWIGQSSSNDDDDDDDDDVHTSSNYSSANLLTKTLTATDLQSGLVDVSGFLLQGNPNHPHISPHHNQSLIITPTTSHNLEALALAIGNEKPVLLLGPTGSGKSALIHHVASLVRRELTTIHIGEALDGKNLLGGYVATEVPGQFKWVEGPLTRAVTNGHWLVIEDLDMASPEVYGILQPLVQSRQLFIPSRAETIHADHGFSLFATATTASNSIQPKQAAAAGESGESITTSISTTTTTTTPSASASSASVSLSKLQQSSFWTKVVIDPLDSNELAQVIEQGFELGQLASLIVSTHESLVSACSRDGISLRAIERPLTTRDILRWAKRTRSAVVSSTQSTGFSETDALALLSSGRTISSGIRELAVKEALDIYISPAQHNTLIETRCTILATFFQLSSDRLDYLRRNRPSLDSTDTSCFVGRSSIPVNTNAKTLTPPLSTLREVFVPTTRSLGLLEWLSMAVQHTEPILLVGETGGGKTSTIQHLAARTRRKLVVLNMSQSSDTVDLLGGFKPVDLSMLATPLKRVFDRIFIKTFSKTKNQEFIDRVHNAHSKKDWRSLSALLSKACKLASTKFEQRRQQQQQRPPQEEEQRLQEETKQVTMPQLGSSPPPPVREVKRRKTAETDDFEDPSSDLLRKAFSSFDDLDADSFPAHLPMEQQWKLFGSRIQRFGVQVDGVKAFQYVEGALVKAVQKGEWVLLDEINLASAETLECLSGLLEGDSLVLSERGDLEAIPRHPDFRLFAAMNPANDVGKSNLPAALRARFSEFYLSELEDRDDLAMIVQGYLFRVNPKPPALSIVDFYLTARKESETRLVDGSNQKPRFNLRSLSRSLEYCADTTNLFGFDRALFEGIQLSFLTQLNTASYDIMNALIHKMIKPKTLNDKMIKSPPSLANFQRSLGSLNTPTGTTASRSGTTSTSAPVTFEQFMLEAGPQDPFKDPRFIVTQTTQKHLTHLARALTTRKYPLLLQGPTSAGKTSMIEYLAKLTGHRFVRVNNSDQTDLQEYLGQYIHDAQGRLVYHDGVLVEALRNGHWICLDELNLAPSEVLEALNRLLDDNRQLYVPELQEYIIPHPHFCLFATQNPPGLYGGRKVLSRAFRSRFLELHIDDIPDAELQLILEQRSHLPASYCQKLVAIMKDLQRQRQGTQVFAGRHGFVTLRDLFRWAERHPSTYDELAIHGYFLLADRLREPEEREIVKQVLEKHLKVSLDLKKIYEEIWLKSFNPESGSDDSTIGQQNIVWTAATKRLFGLMSICLRHKEPILLVGPPGTGKTAISQLHAELLNQHLEILNCHQNSEAADFIGGLRPVRGKDVLQIQLESSLNNVFRSLFHLLPADSSESIMSNTFAQMAMVDAEQIKKIQDEIDGLKGTLLSSSSSSSSIVLEKLMNLLPRLKTSLNDFKQTMKRADHNSHQAIAVVNQAIENAEEKYAEYSAMFTWYDGPLVRTMKRGQCFLVDEISLAEDAVLERLNSVLEPARLLVLAEKGGREIEELVAHADFRIIATMNPGGDFGKKELSPALRNRFTEIFVPAVDQREDLIHIIIKRLKRSPNDDHYNNNNLEPLASHMVDFVEFFAAKTSGTWSYSLRDILAWADFIVTTANQLGPQSAYLHGASMLIIDGLGITNPLNADSLRKFALDFLSQQSLPIFPTLPHQSMLLPTSTLKPEFIVNDIHKFGLGTFTLPKVEGMDIAQSDAQLESYSMKAPTTLSNLLRLLRALQLPKPLLLEGSPGVGKTTIVEALGAACGRKVVRINLSEQTDMLDLLGADLPVEDDVNSLQNESSSSSSEESVAAAAHNTAKFEWRDGVFLNALKNGDWVLLDELNLANQSVLEGLNAVLDHRGTVFIPELNASFVCPPTFRIFAAQNPTAQGGGRKGLPKSFLNRFTKVYLDSFTISDLNFIANALFPELGSEMIAQMIQFNTEVYRATMETFAFGRDGAPWEFNLRDILRWCKLVKTSAERSPDAFVQLLYLQRFRTHNDRIQVTKLFDKCFKRPLLHSTNNPFYQITPSQLQVGQAILPRVLRPTTELSSTSTTTGHHGSAVVEDQPPIVLQHLLPALESLMKCVEFNWLAILVGPTASGKSSLLKLLAWLTGNKLSTFSVNPSVDTLEILGGFEQIDLNRHAKKIVERMSFMVTHITRILLKTSNENGDGLVDAYHLTSMWNLFQSQVKTTSSTESSFSGKSFFATESQQRLTSQLLDLLDNIISKLPEEDTKSLLEIETTSSLRFAVTKIGKLEAKSVAGSFEWVDGLLIDAMERGHWIVLDNVNTCPGPVLDRLLPLLEPNGIIRLNERGLVDGKVAEIVPHPNFRIFFTMDPKFGDISRAMRNRGIEIGMTAIPTEAGTVDMDRLLSRSLQFHAPSLFERMTRFHNSISTRNHPTVVTNVKNHHHHVLPVDTSLGLCDLLHWAELTLDQMQRGEPLGDALSLSMEQVYARGQPSASTRSQLRSHFIDTFSNLDMGSHQQQLKQQLLNAPGFADRLNMMSPQAYALSMVTHTQAVLGLIAGPILNGTPTVFALEHFVRSCSIHWANHWVTSLRAYTSSNASILFEGISADTAYTSSSSSSSSSSADDTDEQTWTHIVQWMMEQFMQSSIVQSAEQSITACVQLLLNDDSSSNNKDTAIWKTIYQDGGVAHGIRHNIPLWRLLSTLASRDESSWTAYATACADLDRVRLWCQTLPLQLHEYQVIQDMSTKSISTASIASLSIAEQSFAIAYRKIGKSSATHPLASLLTTFFAEIDVVLNGFIQSESLSTLLYPNPCSPVAVPPHHHQLVQDLQILLSLRHHLWRWLLTTPSESFQARDFVPSFTWLLKSLRQLHAQQPEHFPISDALEVIVNHMNVMIHEELGAKHKATLWKKEGHPMPIKNSALFQLQSRLQSLNVSSKSSLKESHNTVLRAMATLKWINTIPEGAPNKDKAQISALLNSISHVPDTVSATIASMPVDPFADVAGSSQRESDQQGERKYPLIAPIFDHHLLQLEVYIVQQVQQTLASCQLEHVIPNLGARLASLVPVLQHVIEKSISHTTTSPHHQAGYQLLLWAIESNGSSLQSTSKAASGSDPTATFELLSSICSELRANLGERTVYNSLSTAQLVAPGKREASSFLPPIVIENQKKAKEKDMSRREFMDAQAELSETPTTRLPNDHNLIRLESAYRTAYTMSRLNEWKHVPVVMKQMRMEQMEKLLEFLSTSSTSPHEQDSICNPNGSSTVENDWNFLCDTFSITLQCFITDANYAGTTASTAMIASFGSQAQKLVHQGQVNVFTDLQILLKSCSHVIKQSNDTRFIEVGPRHVEELVNLFAKAFSYAKTFWAAVLYSSSSSANEAESASQQLPISSEYILAQYKSRLLDEPIMRQWRGQIQLELALLRAALLIPSQPIDVSAKYASRALIISNMKDQVESRLSVLIECEKKFTGKDTNYEIVQEKLVLERLDTLLTAARERQVSRPESCPSFHVLWMQLQTLFQAHCNPMRYSDLIHGFLTIRTLPRSIVASQWPALLIRESQFQNNLTQAITDLQSKFYAYYPDVVAPLLNSLFEVKSSLRLIRFSAEMMMPSSLLLGTVSVDSVSSMMNNLQLAEEDEIRAKHSDILISSLHGPSLSCSTDSMYSLASHLQQVISKLTQLPKSLSHGDVTLVLSKSTFEAVTALARLNQARAQAAIAESQAQQALTKGTGVDTRITTWMLAASRTSSILQLQSSLLRASLDSVFEQTRMQGYISQEAYDSLDRIFTVFVETYQAAKAEEEKKRAAEAEFYKYKTQDTTIEHQHDVDEAAFRSMFPDYYEGFEDILGKVRDKPIDPTAPVQQLNDNDDADDDYTEGEEAYKRKKAEEEAAANSPAVMFQGQIYQLNEGEIYQLCRIHFKVFSVLRTYLQPGVQELSDATYYDELEELEVKSSQTSRKQRRGAQQSNKSTTIIAVPTTSSDPTLSSRWKRQTEESNHAFMNAYETAAKLVSLMGETLPRGEQDSVLTGAHILALQQCIEQLTANWRNSEKESSTHGVKKVSKQKRIASRQRRLEAAKAAVVTSFMSSHELVPNFYTAPNAGEACLLQEPLSNYQQRIEDLLAMEEIGENQILITLWKLVTRLLEADVSLPLMHFVTGLELLIDRSQDWDLYQPVRYGVREHLNSCAKFVTRWRAMELQFWPQLLTTKEQQFQLRASKWWFYLYSLLHDTATRCHTAKNLSFGEELGMPPAGPDFAGLLSALQEYIEQSSYGEFPTRLHLLVSFYYQFQAEFDLRGNVCDSNSAALVTMLYNVYRYYAQFLPLLQTEMFKLKEATQLKLEEFIKISKWDDSSFYRLRKTTEASHRNLSKFSKQYELEVLSLPFKGFLEMVASNESLEQLKKETAQALIVSGVKFGGAGVGGLTTSVGPKQTTTTSSQKSLMQTLVDMKSRCQQLIYPLALGAQIFQSSKLGFTSHIPNLSSLSTIPTTATSSNGGKDKSLHMRLESLFAKVSKHSGKLLPQQFEFAHRSHIQLERLTTELIEGILEMRLVAETPVKKRAFANMLLELKSIGLDHHKTAVKAVLKQQSLISKSKSELLHSNDQNDVVIDVKALHDLAFLFSEPICESVVSKILLVASESSSSSSNARATATNERSMNLLTESLDTFWAKSDDYFYKVLAQVLLLRSTENSHSSQLSRAEAQKSLGFADHTFSLLIHQRRTMSLALTRHEKVEKLANAVARLASTESALVSIMDDNTSSQMDSNTHTLPAQMALRHALISQKADLDAFLRLLVSMCHLVLTITNTPNLDRRHLNALLDIIKEAINSITEARNAVESELSAHTPNTPLSHVKSSEDVTSLIMGPRSYISLISSDQAIDANAQRLQSLLSSVFPRLSPYLDLFLSQRSRTLAQRSPSIGSLQLPSVSQMDGTNGGRGDDSNFLPNFLDHFNAAIESLLLAVQKVYKLEKHRMASEKRDIETRQREVEEHKSVMEGLIERSSSESAAQMSILQQKMDISDNHDEEDDRPPMHVFDPKEAQMKDQRNFFDSQLGENDRFLPLNLVDSMKHLDSLTMALDAPTILEHLSRACSLLSNFIDTHHHESSVIQTCSILLQQIYPLLKQWSSLHLAHVHNRSLLCKSSAKFSHVLVSVLASIMKDGFCIKPKAGDGEAEQGETLTDVDGMGLGEGEGDKDVTDQYDEEEQLLGDKPLKDLKKDEKEADPNKPPVDPDTGAEMENDFEGEMHDIEQKEKDKNKDDDDQEEEDGEDDLMDREMADLDPEQEEVLDEKLWEDEDDEDDGKDGKKGKESYEKNAPLENNSKDESEMEARLDDERLNQDDDDDKPQSSKKEKKDKGSTDDANDDEKQDQDDNEEGSKAEEEGDDDDPGKEDPIRNQDDDRYEDSHHKPPHADEEEFALPDELNLDGEEDDNKQGEEGRMDIDDEDSSAADDEDRKEGEDNADKPFPEQPIDGDDDSGDQKPDDAKDGPQNDPENDQKDDENDEIGGNAMALDDKDEEDGANADENGDESDAKKEEREKVAQSGEDVDGKDFSEAFGITDDDRSLPQQQNVKTSENNKQTGGGQDDNMQSQSNEETSDPNAKASATAGASGSTSSRPTPPQSKPNQKEDPNSQQQQRPTQEKQAPTQQKDANPLRSLGDALKHWERQLNVIEDRDESNENPDQGEETPTPTDDNAMNADKNQTFEFARQNEQADQQTLGIASEEQAEQFKQDDHQMALNQEDEETQPKEKTEPEKMDVDAEPEQSTTTVESKSRAPSNRIQTQNEANGDDQRKDEDEAQKNPDQSDENQSDPEHGDDENLVPNYDSIVSKPRLLEKDEFVMEVEKNDVSKEVQVLTQEDLLEMRGQLEQTLAIWKSNPSNIALGGEIWRQLQAITSGAAQQLCEQLRLLLEPTLKSKMQGDYRTGKRLNMRRVVTYVASQFRKDKIWLRRTMPNKRTYQVLLCLDDSQSVLLGNAAPLMREATATLCLALQRLQIGQLGLLKFGNHVDLLHPFSSPFTDEAAAVIMPQLTFEQQTTNMENLMRTSIQMLELSRHEAVMSMGSSSASTMQLMFIIGDGRFGDKRQELATWLHRAQQNNIFVVFLIMDTLDKDQSILDIQSVSSAPNGKISITPYIDDFPYAYYIILKHLDNLPHILSDALRQWFEMINQGDRK